MHLSNSTGLFRPFARFAACAVLVGGVALASGVAHADTITTSVGTNLDSVNVGFGGTYVPFGQNSFVYEQTTVNGVLTTGPGEVASGAADTLDYTFSVGNSGYAGSSPELSLTGQSLGLPLQDITSISLYDGSTPIATETYDSSTINFIAHILPTEVGDTLTLAVTLANRVAGGGSFNLVGSVPVPAALLLFATALGGLAFWGRWKSRRVPVAQFAQASSREGYAFSAR